MLAVQTMTMTMRQWGIFAGSFSLFLTACGGSQAVHSGYPEGESDPWSSATKLTLKDNMEASAEGQVAFPRRERAKWYVLELPAPGAVSAKLTMEPLATGTDVGFEILDEGFNVRAEAQHDDDIGQEKKERKVADARAGRMYFHIFTIGRNDIADYKLRVRYEPKQTGSRTVVQKDPSDPRSTFPWTIPNTPPLAAVPPSDDTPRGRRPVAVKEDPEEEKEKPVKSDDPALDISTPTVRGQIIEFSQSGGGVKITINKGADAGVDEGWTGYVMDNASKKSFPKGSFKIKKVSNDESEAVTNVTLDIVQHNRTVYLKPPK
jgi:hypothetical protein